MLCQDFKIRNDYEIRKSMKIEENFKQNNPKILELFLKLNAKLIDINKFLYDI